VAASLERCLKPDFDDFICQPEPYDAPAHGKHIGVVMQTRHACGVQVIAERGANAPHLVGGDLFPLSAAAEHDAALGAA